MNLKQIRILVVAAVIFVVLDLVFMRVNYGMLSRQLTSMSHKDSSMCTFDGDLGAKLHPNHQQRLIDVQGSSIRPKQVGFGFSYVFLLGGLDHNGSRNGGRRPVPLGVRTVPLYIHNY